MEKEFVNYEIALALKELGFDEKCFGWYNWTGKDLSLTNNSYVDINPTPAPTFSQAFRWFREKYDLVHYIKPHFSRGFNIFIKNIENDKPYRITYKTYEEAELECLIKLIEIVNSQK